MSEQVPDLYGELGAARDASDEVLRAAYRRRARQLHPDVADEATTGDAMRRLNEAWAVLGDPQRRRRYDESRAPALARPAAPAAAAPAPAVALEPEPSTGRRRIPYLRPSMLVLLVLGGLFVVTAYAGSWPGDQGGPPTSTASSVAATTAGIGVSTRVVGQCLADRAGEVAIVACSGPNDGQILAQVLAVEECPAGTAAHLWRQRSTILCAVATNRPSSP